MQLIHRLWREDDGGLTFEWVLLVTILTIGIVGGLAAGRDAIIDEFGDVAEAAITLDHSYRVDFPPEIWIHTPPALQGGSDSQHVDAATQLNDCERFSSDDGQDASIDDPS